MGRSVYLPCLFANLAVRSNVIGAVEVEFIDLGLWHELINFEGTGAFKRNGLKFLRLNFDVLTLADFVTFDDVGGLDLIAGIGVDLLVLDAITGLFSPDES